MEFNNDMILSQVVIKVWLEQKCVSDNAFSFNDTVGELLISAEEENT